MGEGCVASLQDSIICRPRFYVSLSFSDFSIYSLGSSQNFDTLINRNTLNSLKCRETLFVVSQTLFKRLGTKFYGWLGKNMNALLSVIQVISR